MAKFGFNDAGVGVCMNAIRCGTANLNADKPELKVEIYRKDIGEFAELDTASDDFSALPLPARNIARVYEAYAVGRPGDESAWYPDFEYALERHKMLEDMYR